MVTSTISASVAPSAVSEPATKLCLHCGQDQPIGEFRRMRKNGQYRVPECRACHNLRERCRYAQNRMAHCDEFAAAILEARTFRRQEVLCGIMLRSFGGAQAFMDFWREYTYDLIRQSPAKGIKFGLAMATLLAGAASASK